MEDKELLEIYLKGFEQELDGNYNNPYTKGTLEFKAYSTGSIHAIVGDEVSSIDLMTNEETLKIIKNGIS